MRSTPSTSQNSTEEPSWCLIRLVRPTGTTKNSPIANTTETTTVPTQAPPEISCSASGSCALAEMPSASQPDPQRLDQRDHAADHRQAVDRRRRDHGLQRETADRDLAQRRSLPSGSGGLRTATAQLATPRIITPSSTA